MQNSHYLTKKCFIPYICIIRSCKFALFLSPRRHLVYILPEKIHASYKMYFDDNISDTGIGLDVQISMPCIGDFHVSHEFVFALYSKIYYL